MIDIYYYKYIKYKIKYLILKGGTKRKLSERKLSNAKKKLYYVKRNIYDAMI